MAIRSSRLALGLIPVVRTASLSTLAAVMFQSFLPPELWDPGKQSEVEIWLNENMPGPMDRKMILLDWCKFYGIPFTSAKAVAIGAEQLPPP